MKGPKRANRRSDVGFSLEGDYVYVEPLSPKGKQWLKQHYPASRTPITNWYELASNTVAHGLTYIDKTNGIRHG